MIKTKSTADPISKRDGLRIFVTRYWPRGHRRSECDEWVPALAPSETLLHQLRRNEIPWSEFQSRYKSEMLTGYGDESAHNSRYRNSGQKHFLRMLKKMAAFKTITLICDCPPDTKQCHRQLLQSLING